MPGASLKAALPIIWEGEIEPYLEEYFFDQPEKVYDLRLIIGELNRANLSRVFGELMYLLEYRDKTIPLSVSGTQFRVPDNVYLVGTMNTADRSISLVHWRS